MIRLSKRSAYIRNAIEEEDALAEKLIISGRKIVKLNRGDPAVYFPTPTYIMDAFMDAIKESKTGYSYYAGVRELREAISRRHKRLYNLDTGIDDIIVTQGVSEAIIFLNMTLINPNDRAVLLRPYYSLYMPTLRQNGGIPVTVDYLEEGNSVVDIDMLKKKLNNEGKKAKYLIFANPSNPLGSVIDRKELKEIADIANQHDLLIVSDEIYDEIVFNGAKFTSISEVSKGQPIMILGGASKGYDSPGFRIGYAIIPEFRGADKLREKLGDCAKLRLSASTPSQYAFAEAIGNIKEHNKSIKSMVKEIEKRTLYAWKLVNESKYMDAPMPKGAFYVFPKINTKLSGISGDGAIVRGLLVEEGVQTTKGSGFGSPNHIRLVTLAPQDVLELAITRIDRFLKRHSR